MIAKLAETSNSSTRSNSSSGSKFLHLTKDAAAQATAKSNSSSIKKNESSSQSKRKRAKLLDQLLATNWSKQNQQANNLMKLQKMLLVCDANFLDEKSGDSPLSSAISSTQINNASHQMLFTSISAHHSSSLSSSQSSSSSTSNSTSNGTTATQNSLHNLQCQVPVHHGLGRLELISLQQAGITELIQSKAPLIQRILLLLIKSGALIDFRNSDGRTPLHVAATKSNYWALKTLLDLGASTNYRDINGLTPLYYSILQKADLKVTQLLLNHNRSPTNHYNTSNSNSCIGGGSMTAQLSDRARVESACSGTTDDHGWHEVHHACKLGLDAHLEALIYYGCDIDAKISGSGNTPLHVAAINDQLNCAKVLLMRGADKTITNNSHQTAHQVAVISGNMNLAEFIAQHNDSMMVPFRNSQAPSAQKPNIISSNSGSNDVVVRPSEERAFAMFSSRSSANIRIDSQQLQQPSLQSQSAMLLQQLPLQQRHMNPLSLDVFAPPTTNPTAANAAASSGGSSNTTNSINQSLLSIGGNRNHQSQFNTHVNNISPCLSQRSCATSNTTTSSGVCCDGDGNQSNEEQQQQQQHQKEHLSNSHSQHSNVTIISIKNSGALDSTTTGYARESLRTGGDNDDDLRSSSDDGNSNGSSSSCADDLYSLMSEQRPLYAGTIVEAISEYQSGDPNHLQLHRGDLVEVLDYTPELLNAGQLPRLANKPMIFGRRLSDRLTGLYPSFCVRRTKRKSSSQKPNTLRDVTNIDPSIMDDTQWPFIHNENSRPLSESQSMASLDRRSESSFHGFGTSENTLKMQYRELNVTLTKNNNGFGFVLRGAKIDPNLTQSSNSSLTSSDQSNFVGKTVINERMMAANNLISLQYLDEIEPTSAAHLAGLKRGDFLVAVNGQDVRRSSHEQVVHMIRQSGDQVQLTIATPITSQSRAGEQTDQQQPTYMSRGLTRNKPEPPRRDPTTTLTRNKTQRVKSMLVQPQRQVQNIFNPDKPLPYAPDLSAPLSPPGSLNMGRSVSTHLAHFNSVQSLSSSSVIDTQSICSVSTLSADQQQSNDMPTQFSDSSKQTPTHSSSSTTTLTTIAGIKPRAPPKPNLSQIPASGSQQAIYQPAVITTNKRPSPPSMSPQTTPKVQSSGISTPLVPPPPPPPLPNFSIATPQTNSNRLVQRRTSAPLNQSLKDSINQTRLQKKRGSVATIGHHPTPDAPELGTVAAACAAAANSRLQRQQQMQKQSGDDDPHAEEHRATTQETIVAGQAELIAPVESMNPTDQIVEQNNEQIDSMGPPESVLANTIEGQVESRSSLPHHRQVATASLGRKSSAQIIQQPKQATSHHSQTLRARPKQRPSIPDYNELPPPPPPLPSSSEVEFKCSSQQTSYADTSMQQNHHNHHHSNHNHGPSEQIDLDRQQAYYRRSRDDANMSQNNKEEFIRKQQQELVKQQLRHQQLLQQQQQLKIQQQIQLQHQKCCMNAHLPQEDYHGTMRYSSNSAPRVYHNHEYAQQTFDRSQIKQQHPTLQQQQAVAVNKASAKHHHHHHHNHSHHNHHNHHHHPDNYAESLTMPANLQQRQQLHHHLHHHQKPNDHLQHDVYQQHPLRAQAPVMLNHNHVQQQRAMDQQQQQLQQQYYQQLQQQQLLADRYMPVAYAPDNYSAVNTRDS